MKLKLSQFTFPLHDYPQKGEHLLYNVLTRATVKIDDKGFNVLAGLPSVPEDSYTVTVQGGG